MKKVMILLFTMLLTLSLSNSALAVGLKLGGSLNYYSVTEGIFEEVYGKGGLMFGGSLSYEPIRKLEFRAEVNYFNKQGSMVISEEEVTFTLKSVVLGARLRVIEIRGISPYIGGGVDFCSYKEDVPERFEDVSGSKTGYHLGAGIYMNLLRNGSIFFSVIIKHRKLGGIRAGIGIGIQF